LCNALVWDDTRTLGLVREYERKLEEEGIEIDETDEESPEKANTVPNGHPHTKEELGMGTGTKEAAFAEKGVTEGNGLLGSVGKAIGLAPDAVRRKGKEGLVDMCVAFLTLLMTVPVYPSRPISLPSNCAG
jgi:glycerol kinase